MSVSRTKTSAPILCETRAAMRSLSPKRISSLAMASFSLMIGTQPSSINRISVLRACRYCVRSMKSLGTNNTWAPINWCFERCLLYSFISRLCPTAASACNVSVSVGRCFMPSAATPPATAPEVTTTTSCLSARSFATCSQSVAMASVLMLPRSSVTDEVPIFTTILIANSRVCSRN